MIILKQQKHQPVGKQNPYAAKENINERYPRRKIPGFLNNGFPADHMK